VLLSAEKRSTAIKAKLFRGLADPSRLSILEALVSGPRTVMEIVQETGLSQPNVSNHLGCLEDCGLVLRVQQGKYVHCQLSDARVAALLRIAEELLADVAHGVYACTRYEPEQEG